MTELAVDADGRRRGSAARRPCSGRSTTSPTACPRSLELGLGEEADLAEVDAEQRRPAARASSAARSNVPSPPSANTISQPSARPRRGGHRPRRPGRSRSPASSASTRTSKPAAMQVAGDGAGACSHACPSPPGVRDQQRVRRRPRAASRSARSTADPVLDGPTPAIGSSAAAASRRSHRKNSTLPRARAAGWRPRRRTPSPSAAAAAATSQHRLGAQRRVADHAAGADPLLADLELRLDQQHQVAVRRGAGGQRGQHQPQRDERQVGDGQVDRAADGSGVSSRTLVRSSTRTRASVRSGQASWP